MWLVELMLVSLIGGTIFGVSLRIIDDWRERTEADKLREKTEDILGKGWIKDHQTLEAVAPSKQD